MNELSVFSVLVALIALTFLPLTTLARMIAEEGERGLALPPNLFPASAFCYREGVKRAHAITLGCKINQAETDDLLARAGIARVAPNMEADFVLVNTCTVTMEADKQSRQQVRRALRRGCPVLVTGCSANIHPETFRALGAIVVPKEKLLEELTRRFGSAEPTGIERTRGFLKLTEGCTNHCTYCIVPAARGAERPLSFSLLLEQAERFAAAGLKEVVLAGTRLGTYPNFPERVLQLIERFPAIRRWRLSSIEPLDLTPEIARLWEHPKLCPHLHLPLQSGSDRVLLRMNRRYDREGYALGADLLKNIPRFTLTTDLIVGFPGETEEDFRQTLEAVDRWGFAAIHAFPFSPRPGTPAASFEPLPPRTLRERLERLLEKGQAARRQWLEGWLGAEVEVLVEKVREPRLRTGLTPHYLRVEGESAAEQGELVRARVLRVEGDGGWGIFP